MTTGVHEVTIRYRRQTFHVESTLQHIVTKSTIILTIIISGYHLVSIVTISMYDRRVIEREREKRRSENSAETSDFVISYVNFNDDERKRRSFLRSTEGHSVFLLTEYDFIYISSILLIFSRSRMMTRKRTLCKTGISYLLFGYTWILWQEKQNKFVHSVRSVLASRAPTLFIAFFCLSKGIFLSFNVDPDERGNNRRF